MAAFFITGEINMSYNILVEWATSKRGFGALRNEDPRITPAQEKILDEAITENAELIFKADNLESENFIGKAGRTTFSTEFYSDKAAGDFVRSVQEQIGFAMEFEVTAEAEAD
jgi:hypothetical protein